MLAAWVAIMMGKAVIGALMLSVLLAFASDQRSDEPHSPAPESVAPPVFVAPDSDCVEWTDDCRVCVKTAEQVACSNAGIACQPGVTHCTQHRRQGGLRLTFAGRVASAIR